MKKYMVMLTMLFSIGAYAQHKKQNSFILKGTILNAAKVQVYLEEAKQVSNTIYKDSTFTDATGKFSFTGTIPEPRLFTVQIKGRNQFSEIANVFIENNSIVSLNGLADSLYKAEVKGSKEQILVNEFIPNFSRRFAAFKATLEQPYYEAKAKNDSVAMLREAQIASRKTIDEVSRMIVVFVTEHPSSAMSLELVQVLMKYQRISTVDSLMHIIEKTPAGNYAFALKIREGLNIKNRLIVGALAPDFSQQDTSGRYMSLSGLRGKYVLVDFWASWCKPCRAENPNVLKAYLNFKDKNFTVLAVSMDKDRKSWIKAIQEDKLPWVQLSDLKGFDNEAGKLYAIESIPMNYLIDPRGKIVALNLRGENLDKKLQELLK